MNIRYPALVLLTGLLMQSLLELPTYAKTISKKQSKTENKKKIYKSKQSKKLSRKELLAKKNKNRHKKTEQEEHIKDEPVPSFEADKQAPHFAPTSHPLPEHETHPVLKHATQHNKNKEHHGTKTHDKHHDPDKKADKEPAKKAAPSGPKYAYLDKPLPPPVRKKLITKEEEEERFEINLKKATLSQLVTYIEKLFDIVFITSDAIKLKKDDTTPARDGVEAHLITFNTHKPLKREAIWDLFLTFLNLANLSTVPQGQPGFYRIMPIETAGRAPVPSFVGHPPEVLPDNDSIIRYVFFVENSPLPTIAELAKSMASKTAKVNQFDDMNAIVITDRSSNIRSLMKIINEIDKETPEIVSVVKLKKADAVEVQKLYESLVKEESPRGIAQILGKKGATSLYFTGDARVIADQRTNSIILLGPKVAVERIEEFVRNHIDKDLYIPHSPLHIYPLQFARATDVAQILQKVTSFAPTSDAARFGGVRGGEKYFGPVKITPDEAGNRLIIKAEDDDYLHLEEVIKKLDVKQPQVAIEALIVNVETGNTKILGSQTRSELASLTKSGFPIKGLEFQTSGLHNETGQSSLQLNTTEGSSGSSSNSNLLGNLLSLATSQDVGSMLVSIGNHINPWALFKMLDKHTHSNVVASPFITTTNKCPATIQTGETRYVKTGELQTSTGPTSSYGDKEANLTMKVTPQINSDGMIQMKIEIDINEFVNTTQKDNANTYNKSINTVANVADGQMLVLGGMTRSKKLDSSNKAPLGDVPVVGWLFKSKRKIEQKESLLIFIVPHIISDSESTTEIYTKNKIHDVNYMLAEEAKRNKNKKDPIDATFFADTSETTKVEFDEFLNGETKDTEAHKRLPQKQSLSTTNKAKTPRTKTGKRRPKSSEQKYDSGLLSEPPQIKIKKKKKGHKKLAAATPVKKTVKLAEADQPVVVQNLYKTEEAPSVPPQPIKTIVAESATPKLKNEPVRVAYSDEDEPPSLLQFVPKDDGVMT